MAGAPQAPQPPVVLESWPTLKDASTVMLEHFDGGAALSARGQIEPDSLALRGAREILAKMGPAAIGAYFAGLQYYNAEWGCPDQTGTVDSDCPEKAWTAGWTSFAIVSAVTLALNLTPRKDAVRKINRLTLKPTAMITNPLAEIAYKCIPGSDRYRGEARNLFIAKALLSGAVKGLGIGAFSLFISYASGVPIKESTAMALSMPTLAGGFMEGVTGWFSKAYKGASQYLTGPLRDRDSRLDQEAAARRGGGAGGNADMMRRLLEQQQGGAAPHMQPAGDEPAA